MSDLFDQQAIEPMLIGQSGDPFDSADYIHELKLDGIRCLAYLDDTGTELRNKRNLRVARIYPELSGINTQVDGKCILDGEVFIMKDGQPNFTEIKRRALMSDQFKIRIASKQLPVSFTAFDILYKDGVTLTALPLMERKEILANTIRESDRLSVSRYLDTDGISLYHLTEQQGLEGIVSKLKTSKYYFGKRTKEWIKIKNLQDDDFVVCGYIEKDKNIVSIVIGQYDSNTLLYKGHVTLGVSAADFLRIKNTPAIPESPFDSTPKGNEQAVWIKPVQVCTVKYMEKTSGGGLRQPVFKGLRNDKLPSECRAEI